MSILTEGLNYLDMENQMFPTLYIDEYAAKMGEDKDIITLSFMVKSYAVGEDLVSWFERGYNFVLDASVSEGELEPGKFLVFVEMDRRSWVPKKIYELIFIPEKSLNEEEGCAECTDFNAMTSNAAFVVFPRL